MLFEKLQLPALSFSNDITYRLGSCSKLASPVSFLIQPKVNRKSSPMKASSIGMFSNGRRKGFVTTIARRGSRKKPIRRFSSMKKWERVRKLRSLQIEFPCQTFLLISRSFYFLLEFIDAVMFLSFVSTQRLEIDKDINFSFLHGAFSSSLLWKSHWNQLTIKLCSIAEHQSCWRIQFGKKLPANCISSAKILRRRGKPANR